MSKPTVEILLQQGPWPGDDYRHAWPIGAAVRGRVSIHAPDATKTRRMTAELAWRTEGRGDTDRGTAASVTLHEGDLHAGATLARDIELAVPEDGPLTYDGHLIRIMWAVVVRIDIPWGRDVIETVEVAILSDYESAAPRATP